MKTLKIVILGMAFGSCGASFAWAEVKWDREEINLTAGRGERELKTECGFVNAGKKPVEFKSVKASCGCTAVSLRLGIYQPGERGAVGITYAVGDRRGVRHELVIVETNDGAMPKKILSLNVNIPSGARFNLDRVEWKIAGEPDAKKVILRIDPDFAPSLKGVTASSPKLRVSFKEVAPKVYEIILKPDSTADPLAGLIQVRLEDHDALQTASLPFRIRK